MILLVKFSSHCFQSVVPLRAFCSEPCNMVVQVTLNVTANILIATKLTNKLRKQTTVFCAEEQGARQRQSRSEPEENLVPLPVPVYIHEFQIIAFVLSACSCKVPKQQARVGYLGNLNPRRWLFAARPRRDRFLGTIMRQPAAPNWHVFARPLFVCLAPPSPPLVPNLTSNL